MERNLLIKELKNMKLVAHRLGYQMTNYPENSMEVLEEIFSKKELLDSCDGFEFDICFTKDHVPIVVHDKYVDDISDEHGLFKDYTFNEISNFKFRFRKSLNTDQDFVYRIITLEEILNFFNNNRKLLKDKIIKIETKDSIIRDETNLKIFADLLNKYSLLSNNIVHLSFWPFNLKILKRIQLSEKYTVVKNDFLCDYSILVKLARFMPYLDNVSLRIKTDMFPKKSKAYSRVMNRKIKSDSFWMKFSNVIREKILMSVIDRYGSVNLYTLNDDSEINDICKHISEEFFLKYKDKIVITTNNPKKLREFRK